MASTSQTVGRVVTGCGCLTMMALFAWLIFVAIIGIQGRGNDAETSVIIATVTCVGSLPVLLLTIVGAVFAFRSPPEET